MAIVKVKLTPFYHTHHRYESSNQDFVRSYKQTYSVQAVFEVEQSGEAAAEEVFDLTGNPSRQAERDEKYGSHRSVSVGDIIEVDGIDYFCAPIGWEVV
jgi:hypothetical protein